MGAAAAPKPNCPAPAPPRPAAPTPAAPAPATPAPPRPAAPTPGAPAIPRPGAPAPGGTKPKPPRPESAAESIGGSVPNIESTDLWSSADFFSQSAGEAIKPPVSDFSRSPLPCFGYFAKSQRSHRVHAPCVPVPLEDQVARPLLRGAPKLLLSQSRSASSSLAP